jgi:hypothetical protein
MNAIGGYFGLELAAGSLSYHTTPHNFKSGRSSLHYILRMFKPQVVYIPYYTCDGILESFAAAGVNFKFYEINELLEPVSLPELKANEYFLYINYFDIKRNKVAALSQQYGDKLIVDSTQSFFEKGNGKSWYFNSCRKFFGVPDGSYLYVPYHINTTPVPSKNEVYKVDHLIQRFNGHPEQGYKSFQENEVLLGADIVGMSRLSEHILSFIDYSSVIATRRSNYQYLHEIFKGRNILQAELETDSVPMYYPLLLDTEVNKYRLYAKNMYVPTFWKDVMVRGDSGFETEKKLTTNLLPLPVDHRYTIEDMERLAEELKEII